MISSASRPARAALFLRKIAPILCLAAWLNPVASFGQGTDLCPAPGNPDAEKLYDKARSARKSRKPFEKVKTLCENAIESDTTYALPWLLLGDAAWFAKDYKTMKSAYAKAIELCPDASEKMHYRLGTYLYDTKKYEECLPYLNSFLSFGSERENWNREAELLIVRARLQSNPVPFEPRVVKGVSTHNPEYLAVITADNEYCYFTRRFEMKSKSMLTPIYVEKFMIARRDSSGQFDEGKPLDWPFNLRNNNNEGGPSISIDNQHLYFTFNDNNNFDIWYSAYKPDGWDPTENLGPGVNDSLQWDSQPSINKDNSTLYFASYRDSVNRTSDLFVTRKKNGSWTSPEKLGARINTNGNEKSPFIHPDDQTLYFSSDSLPGMGGFDIFMSKKDSLGHWGTPVNLGYPINTYADEVGFFVSTDGKTGYFSSNSLGGKGGYDLYSFDMPAGKQPEKVLMVTGNLRDEDNAIPYAARIELRNITTSEVTNVVYDSLTGKYASVVLFDHDYIMTVKKKGAAFTSKYFAHDDTLNSRPVSVNFDVRKIELGHSYTLRDILFETDSYELTQMSKRVIEDFSEFLKENRGVRVAIYGHTDNQGDAALNLRLSDQRARAVYRYLLSLGISPSRLSSRGFGQIKPVATNDTPGGRAKNRRTEFYITQK